MTDHEAAMLTEKINQLGAKLDLLLRQARRMAAALDSLLSLATRAHPTEDKVALEVPMDLWTELRAIRAVS